MTVAEYFQRIYEEIDKEGMPYFEEDELLRRLKTASYNFLDKARESIQFDQKAKEDLSMITSEFNISGNEIGLFDFGVNFYSLVSLRAKFGLLVRPLPIVQSNDIDKLKDDPFNTPTTEYPFAEFYQNSVKVYPLADSISGLFLNKIIFGSITSEDILPQLPLHIQLHIIQLVILHLMTTIGDSRIQAQYYQVANKNTDS
jgi:hypothetical protein